MTASDAKHLLLVITGSIAACKVPDIIRLAQQQGVVVTCVQTASAQQFIPPLTLGSLTGRPVYDDLFSPLDETGMDHIRLSREADMILVAPATANILAKMTHGLADDLASTVLMAADKPIYVAPAMNVQMWSHPATQRNIKQLQEDGVQVIFPEEGELACGASGVGRMAEPQVIIDALIKKGA